MDEIKKKICMIGAFPPPINGEAVAFETLADAEEINNAFEIKKIDFAPKKKFAKPIMQIYKIGLNLQMLSLLKKDAKEGKTDIYYLGISCSERGCNRDFSVVDIISKYAPESKLVLHHHGGNFRTFYENTSEKKKKRIRNYLDRADKIIVLTPKLTKLFDGLARPDKICVVSNGVNKENILPEEEILSHLKKLSQRKYVSIVYLSNMIMSKGFFILLEAVGILVKQGIRDFKVYYAGAFRKEEDRKKFNFYIEENSLQEIVKYLGLLKGDKKNKLLLEGDIFVLPTFYPNEGQPISILEAMAAGMCIITTDHGGITDVVKDEKNGVILKKSSAVELAESIAELMRDKNRLQIIGQRNMKEAIEKYSETKYISEMMKIFMI